LVFCLKIVIFVRRVREEFGSAGKQPNSTKSHVLMCRNATWLSHYHDKYLRW